MHQILFKFKAFGAERAVGTYGVIGVLACLAAYLLARRLIKAKPFNGSFPYDTLLLIIVGGLSGAFAVGLALSLISGANSTDSIMLVSWGGIIGGAVAFAFVCRFWHLPTGALADLFSPAYLLGIGIGRIGCLFGGCCFGVHTDSCIGISFTDPAAPASAGLQPLVPVQLISAAYLIAGAGLFTILYLKRSSFTGKLFLYSAMYYSAGRFTIEFWRNDFRLFLFGLSDGQIFSLLLFAVSLFCLVFRTRRSNFSKKAS